ncbi:hypothetical protein NP173_24230, partial [Salmonella enterica]|nr:hypothetical protein [Salmonella enterica]
MALWLLEKGMAAAAAAAGRRPDGAGALGPSAALGAGQANSHNAVKLRFPAEDEFPDLSGHNNHMA